MKIENSSLNLSVAKPYSFTKIATVVVVALALAAIVYCTYRKFFLKNTPSKSSVPKPASSKPELDKPRKKVDSLAQAKEFVESSIKENCFLDLDSYLQSLKSFSDPHTQAFLNSKLEEALKNEQYAVAAIFQRQGASSLFVDCGAELKETAQKFLSDMRQEEVIEMLQQGLIDDVLRALDEGIVKCSDYMLEHVVSREQIEKLRRYGTSKSSLEFVTSAARIGEHALVKELIDSGYMFMLSAVNVAKTIQVLNVLEQRSSEELSVWLLTLGVMQNDSTDVLDYWWQKKKITSSDLVANLERCRSLAMLKKVESLIGKEKLNEGLMQQRYCDANPSLDQILTNCAYNENAYIEMVDWLEQQGLFSSSDAAKFVVLIYAPSTELVNSYCNKWEIYPGDKYPIASSRYENYCRGWQQDALLYHLKRSDKMCQFWKENGEIGVYRPYLTLDELLRMERVGLRLVFGEPGKVYQSTNMKQLLIIRDFVREQRRKEKGE